MTIPALGAMQADIHLVRGLDEVIGKLWTAARTEDDACFAEGLVDVFVPPARVPEFYNVGP